MKDALIQWDSAVYWTRPYNPMVGCHPISPACDHCYAASNCARFGCSFDPHMTTKCSPPKQGVVFCGNMTDLFGDWVDRNMREEFIWRALKAGVSHNANATYLWLTKRPLNMADALKHGMAVPHDHAKVWETYKEYPLGNQFFGFTAENQEWYDNRVHQFFDHLPKGGYSHNINVWLSAEPLLGDIDLRIGKYGIRYDWIVVGCESGANRRPCPLEWIDHIVRQAIKAKVPVFVKQLNIDGKCVKDIMRFPEHLRIRQVPWHGNRKES